MIKSRFRRFLCRHREEQRLVVVDVVCLDFGPPLSHVHHSLPLTSGSKSTECSFEIYILLYIRELWTIYKNTWPIPDLYCANLEERLPYETVTVQPTWIQDINLGSIPSTPFVPCSLNVGLLDGPCHRCTKYCPIRTISKIFEIPVDRSRYFSSLKLKGVAIRRAAIRLSLL